MTLTIRSSIGCLLLSLPFLVLFGCGGDDEDGTSGRLYAVCGFEERIVCYGNVASVNGDVTPVATIEGSLTTLWGAHFIYLDINDDRLYIANHNQDTIIVYNDVSTKDGNVAPDRIISSSGFNKPIDVTLNESSDVMYVSNMSGGEIFVFENASTIDGSVVPDRTITSSTPLIRPHGILLDTPNDQLYVVDMSNQAVKVFENISTADGVVTPSRTIQGDNTGFIQPIYIRIDRNGDLIVEDRGGQDSVPSGDSLMVFEDAETVDGNVSPIREITGSNTTLDRPHQIFYLDSTDEVYVANAFNHSISIFSDFSNSSGNLSPTRSLAGANTGLPTLAEHGGPIGIAIDMTRD